MARASLKDVAREAGTSVSAVSKALNGSSEISVETSQRIFDAAARLGYYPNNSARSIRLGKSFRIGVMLPSFSGVYADILAGIEDYAKPSGYASVVLNTQNRTDVERDCLAALLSMPVDALLSVPVALDNYENLSLPLIFLSRFPFCAPDGDCHWEIPDFNYVIVNDYEGQRLAAEHLIKCCGKNIYIALGCADTSNVWGCKDRIRLAGFKRALADAGLPYQEERVLWGATEAESGYAVTMELCQRAQTPFGLCVNDDITAMGAIHAISDSALEIPSDVSIIGYDNLSFSQHTIPPLTTVHSQKFSAGQYAARQIIAMLEDKAPRHCKKLFEPFLCTRQTALSPIGQ